eukprot:TRINITY_DN471_c0_g1_i9.p1 TRINITY_DN471_c0_g1~~TRINITY_DN471_c0_g1_i9.p1  ORF type:complete len:313 (-),score=84.78 TRINITY_DN471_c0_g1_i9:87-1025(-)
MSQRTKNFVDQDLSVDVRHNIGVQLVRTPFVTNVSSNMGKRFSRRNITILVTRLDQQRKEGNSVCSSCNASTKTFCEDCGQILCAECLVRDHRGHQFSDILKNVEHKKVEFGTFIDEVKGELEKTQTKRSELKKEIEKLQSLLKQETKRETLLKITFSKLKLAQTDLPLDQVQLGTFGQLEKHLRKKLLMRESLKQEGKAFFEVLFLFFLSPSLCLLLSLFLFLSFFSSLCFFPFLLLSLSISRFSPLSPLFSLLFSSGDDQRNEDQRKNLLNDRGCRSLIIPFITIMILIITDLHSKSSHQHHHLRLHHHH